MHHSISIVAELVSEYDIRGLQLQASVNSNIPGRVFMCSVRGDFLTRKTVKNINVIAIVMDAMDTNPVVCGTQQAMSE